MASSKSTVRIYIRDMEVIRAIYWLEIGSDDSAYFGTSVTDFKRTGLQCIDVTTDGGQIEMDPGKLEAVDVGGKHSLHKSGVLLGHRLQGKKRVERHTIEITQYRTCIPLVGVLLMNPLIYPRTSKSLRSSDIVLSTVKFANHPFAFLLYLQPDGAEDAKVLNIYREQGMCVEAHSRIGKIHYSCSAIHESGFISELAAIPSRSCRARRGRQTAIEIPDFCRCLIN